MTQRIEKDVTPANKRMNSDPLRNPGNVSGCTNYVLPSSSQKSLALVDRIFAGKRREIYNKGE